MFHEQIYDEASTKYWIDNRTSLDQIKAIGSACCCFLNYIQYKRLSQLCLCVECGVVSKIWICSSILFKTRVLVVFVLPNLAPIKYRCFTKKTREWHMQTLALKHMRIPNKAFSCTREHCWTMYTQIHQLVSKMTISTIIFNMLFQLSWRPWCYWRFQ